MSGLFTSLTLPKIQSPGGDEPGQRVSRLGRGVRRLCLAAALAVAHLGEGPPGNRAGERRARHARAVASHHWVKAGKR